MIKNIENTCCFTGHRYEDKTEIEDEIKPLLKEAINNAINSGYTEFITGMALGTDVWAAEIVLDKKKSNKEIKLLCALPHLDFERKRKDNDKERYNEILKNADETIVVNAHYFRGCYQKRNVWMVDRSSLVIAVFNGEKGGTKNTIDYASRKNRRINNVLEK